MYDRRAIEGLLPHSGAMCLLERVEQFDEGHIVCFTTSHRSPGNPLRRHGRLSAVHAVEYGAQAAAIHRGLLAPSGRREARAAFLTNLTDVNVRVAHLDALEGELQVEAWRLLDTGKGAVYRFAVSAGASRICDGRASVMEPGP